MKEKKKLLIWRNPKIFNFFFFFNFRGLNIVIESLCAKLWQAKSQISTFNLFKKIFISGSSIISFIKSLIIQPIPFDTLQQKHAKFKFSIFHDYNEL